MDTTELFKSDSNDEEVKLYTIHGIEESTLVHSYCFNVEATSEEEALDIARREHLDHEREFIGEFSNSIDFEIYNQD